MKYTKIPATTFKNIQLNAGVLATAFTPATGTISGNLIGATTGGVNFVVTPEFVDFGEDIDNCPKNTKELKKQNSVEASMSGTFAAITAALGKSLVAAGDIDEQDATHIVPRLDLNDSDFVDIWWIGDYSDVNDGDDAGYIAIHMMNALNTGGFQIQSTDKAKGTFPFTYTAHFSMSDPTTVPFEIYVKEGGEPTPFVLLNKHSVTVADGETLTLIASKIPADAVVTWDSDDDNTATVTSGGVVEGIAAGSTIISATITVDGVDYNDTCTVIVTA